MALHSSQLKTNAIWKGQLVDEILSKEELKVHSIFSRVINIKAEENMVSLAWRRAGRAAGYISIAEEVDFKKLCIPINSSIAVKDSIMHFDGPLSVDMKSTYIWLDKVDEHTRWNEKHLSIENVAALKSAVDRYGAAESLWKNSPEIIRRLAVLSPEESIKSILGFGSGLTPGGDDAIIGFLAAVDSKEGNDEFSNRLKAQILGNIKATTDISSQFLKLACSRHYHEYLQDALLAIIHGSPENALWYAKKLISIGSSSGTDLAGGMYLGFTQKLKFEMAGDNLAEKDSNQDKCLL